MTSRKSKKDNSKGKDDRENKISVEEGTVFTVNITDEYVKLIKKGLVIVDFNTEWCGPCKKFAVVFEELAKLYPKVVFLSVDAEKVEHEDTQSITSVPTFKIFFDGRLKREFSGTDRDRLEEYIKRYTIQIFINGRVVNDFDSETKSQIEEYMSQHEPK